ncbi:MAG: AraC family transcriptional regulator [Bacteroidales bacterium]|nr:AraC family transcriptional regulator [Bacteroidales bacterium]
MAKTKQPDVRDIDESIRKELKLFDNIGLNIVEDDYALIMDNTPVVKNLIPKYPMRSKEHRIMLVKEGWVKHSLNYNECTSRKKDLLFIPANFIICVKDFSKDLKARVLTFNFSEAFDMLSSIGFSHIHLSLGPSEEKRMDSYFQLMYQVLQSPCGSKRDFDFLVLSMLSRIVSINNQQNGGRPITFRNEKQKCATLFMQMITDPDINYQKIKEFASELKVTENYLSVAVKDITGNTVKYWIDYRNVMLIKKHLESAENLPLDQIAVKLGYSSASTLVRYFKKQTGQTPAEFRKELKISGQ